MEKAVHYARLAAEQAIGRSAFAESTSIIEEALTLRDKIPDGVERIRAELALRNVEWALGYVRSARPHRNWSVSPCTCASWARS